MLPLGSHFRWSCLFVCPSLISSDSSTLNMSEPRARRTHARRSCQLCKVRKTRCELPDLEVPSSVEPLAVDKSCHRCKVLSLPCVVDDTLKKSRKKPARQDAANSTPETARSEAPEASTSRSNALNHSLDLVHGFTPVSAPRNVPPRSMRLHGRPFELLCEMMSVAYSHSQGKGKRKIDVYDVDLHLDPDMRARIEPG